MNFILFDENERLNFLPFTDTKPIAELRVGILTIKEKWEKYLQKSCSFKTVDYLQEKFSHRVDSANVFVNACLLPNKKLTQSILNLNSGEALYAGETLLAYSCEKDKESPENSNYQVVNYAFEFSKLETLPDIFLLNKQEIEADFELLTHGRISEPIPKGVQTINESQIFIEQGAQVLFATLNASEGPIYIGKNSTIMEGSQIRGPFCLGENSVIKMGAKIYGSTTIGPFCKIGGELSNTVFMGYSNKGHDGYLGNSVVGEWCNLGAGSSNSNLKNNYSTVKLWCYAANDFVDTKLQFCGVFMGDYSKFGINTSINTGSVIGTCVSYSGAGVPPKFLPSFTWATSENKVTYDFEKAMKTSEIVMARRGVSLTETDRKILKKVFDNSDKLRSQVFDSEHAS